MQCPLEVVGQGEATERSNNMAVAELSCEYPNWSTTPAHTVILT